MRRILATLVVACLLGLGSAAAAMAAPNPSGTGPPNQTCQDFLSAGGTAPGNSGTSPGSVFNEPGFGSVNGGTGGSAYNNAGAPSQYDVACFQVNQTHP